MPIQSADNATASSFDSRQTSLLHVRRCRQAEAQDRHTILNDPCPENVSNPKVPIEALPLSGNRFRECFAGSSVFFHDSEISNIPSRLEPLATSPVLKNATLATSCIMRNRAVLPHLIP